MKNTSVLSGHFKISMDKGSASSYVYAKISGMLAKSFTGERAAKLFDVQNLSQLWSLIFKKEAPAVPQNMLSRELEKEAQKSFINQYVKLIENYSNPPQILISLLSYFEYENLKEIAIALERGFEKIPEITDISLFSRLDYSKWPDLSAITAGTCYDWYKISSNPGEQQKNDFKLDVQYVREIWNGVKKTDLSCRKTLENLIGEKIAMENAIWALRLKIYYKMHDIEILNHLVYSSDENYALKNTEDIFVKEAVKILKWDIDDWNEWENWKFSSFLNPHEEGVVWTVDPRWISNEFKSYYVCRALSLFHRFPFTECPLICFFIVKRNELDNIRTATESIRLNIASAQAMEIAGLNET